MRRVGGGGAACGEVELFTFCASLMSTERKAPAIFLVTMLWVCRRVGFIGLRGVRFIGVCGL